MPLPPLRYFAAHADDRSWANNKHEKGLAADVNNDGLGRKCSAEEK